MSTIQSAGDGRPPRLLATIIFLIGAFLGGGGIWLAALGGSVYYAVVGAAMVISALLLWRGRRTGALVYGALLLGTLIWAFAEVGLDGWALLPRLGLLMALGAWLMMPWVRRGLA